MVHPTCQIALLHNRHIPLTVQPKMACATWQVILNWKWGVREVLCLWVQNLSAGYFSFTVAADICVPGVNSPAQSNPVNGVLLAGPGYIEFRSYSCLDRSSTSLDLCPSSSSMGEKPVEAWGMSSTDNDCSGYSHAKFDL